MNSRAIVPVKLSLLQGDYFTLWAPTWHQHGTSWQAFLGNDESILLFESPAHLLTFIENNRSHDLHDHPEWNKFQARGEQRVVPEERDNYALVDVPALLAEKPTRQNVSAVARNFEVAQALAEVGGAEDAAKVFASHSVLRNASRGVAHFQGPAGLSEWSGIGRVVLANWKSILEGLDAVALPDATIAPSDADAEKVADADSRIRAAEAELAKAEEEEKARAEAAEAAADPYDNSIWGRAGIDPVKITIDNRSVYTLRTYVNRVPVFLGKWGEIFTFPTGKQLARWVVENNDHDLARVATWEDITTAANAGELEVTVHPDNQYTFTGIAAGIEKGPEAVDSEQMARCYEVCADAADWAQDDSINSFMLANPKFPDYLSYMVGSTEHVGYVPSKPYSDHVAAWKGLEEMLVKRFSKF